MSNDEINFKDLSDLELDKLKDIYVESRLKNMSEADLRNFFRISIEDQIKGTVGNQEEKEAWLEMKEYFKDDFQDKILIVRKGNQVFLLEINHKDICTLFNKELYCSFPYAASSSSNNYNFVFQSFHRYYA